MNIQHLKYALEVEKTGSINKVAEKLNMGQPNLSRAIKELEQYLGITVFERSAKGMVPTSEGEEFLGYAKKIINQIDDVEEFYKSGIFKKQRFSVCAPEAGYITHAFASFTEKLDSRPAEVSFKEADSNVVIKNVINMSYKLGIVRYEEADEKYLKKLLKDNGLEYIPVAQFKYVVMMNEECPLAKIEDMSYSDFAPYIEVVRDEPSIPSPSAKTIKKHEMPQYTERKIFAPERRGRYEILAHNKMSFMWATPVPDDIAAKYGIVQKRCADHSRLHKDIVIFRSGYRLTELDSLFIKVLKEYSERYFG